MLEFYALTQVSGLMQTKYYKTQFPRRLSGEKKSYSYNQKTTIRVSHNYFNPEFHKILSRAFWVIAILRFFPYVARVDFKGLISK